MRIRFLLLALLGLSLAPTAAWSQASVYMCVELTTGLDRCQHVSVANPLPVTATFTPSGTQNVNLTQILSAAPSLTNPLWVFPATGATFPVSGTFFQATQPVSIASAQVASGAISSGAVASGAIASGAFASGAIGSGAIASGAVASGAYASGAFASGAFASGAFASGSQAVGITPTDRTITSATGSSQTAMSSNATRKSLIIVNTGNANCGINPTGGTAVIGGAGTITLAPTGSYTPRVPTLAAVTVICTAGQPIYAEES